MPDKTIPLTCQLDISEIIGVLGDDFSNIYCVDRESQDIDIYRYQNTTVGVREVQHEKSAYLLAMQSYIEANVLQEDREKMKQATTFDHVCQQLQQVSQFTVHYRVRRDNEVLFYRMKCARIGEADTFRKIIFAFASEDQDVRLNELGVMMKSSGATGKRKILIIAEDRQVQEMLDALLENKYEIVTTRNYDSGLQLLETHHADLSLVLLDVGIPPFCAFDFLKRVREDPLLSLVPVLALSADPRVDTELACLDLAAADFIPLPRDPEVLRRRIRNAIRLKESTLTLQAVEHDELTGLYTSQAFFHYVKQIIRFKPDKPMHLIVAKVKDFKLINSIYGARKADQLLCHLANHYKQNLRDGLLARRGSSFLCLLYSGRELAPEKMRSLMEDFVRDAPIPGIRLKCGVCRDFDKTLPIAAVCDNASIVCDFIMDDYERDIAYYTEEIAQKRIREQLIESSFETAMAAGEFVVYYQPKVDLHTEAVVGAEALVRWKKPDGSMVSPGEFVPIYERDGLIEKLDEAVFRQVCQLQQRLQRDRQPLLPISVNLSRSSILHSGVAERYIRIASERGIPFSCVPLEITESSVLYSTRIQKTAEQLVHAGFELQMDDFGSGCSSLSCLNQIPFHTLKIDKSLVDHVCTPNGRTLVEQVILLAKMLRLNVVAEGAETREQILELRTMACDEIQGFYYARPLPEQEFLVYVQTHRG